MVDSTYGVTADSTYGESRKSEDSDSEGMQL